MDSGWRRQNPDVEVATNVLNKPSRTDDKGLSSSLVMGEGLKTLTVKITSYKMLYNASELDESL
jgi:hypothetical protein